MKTALCAVSTLLAAMAVLYASTASDGKKREMALNAVYQRAFYETCEYVSGMENDLSKLSATSSARTQVSLLDDLSRRAQGAQCNLALLPVSMDAATATMKFVNQAGDYAETLSARLSAGGTLGEEDRAQLGVLSESASLFASRLDEALTTACSPSETRKGYRSCWRTCRIRPIPRFSTTGRSPTCVWTARLAGLPATR